MVKPLLQYSLPVQTTVSSHCAALTVERRLRAVGLFAGIGGIELGLSRAGHSANLFCEIDSAAANVLGRRFAGVEVHDDVRTLAEIPSDTQLIAGGFPCQDLSQAGRTAGIAGVQSGLIEEVLKLLRRTEIPWVLLENVPFMLQLGNGRALDVIVSALEELQYYWAYRVVDTRAFGLPQRRRRVFIVATKLEDPRRVLLADDAGEPSEDPQDRTVACGFYWTEGIRGLGWAVDAVPTLKGGSTIGVPSPPAILLPDGWVVTPDIRDAERLQGFPEDWTQPAEEVTRASFRWKLVGNAVSVPVASWVGERLAKPGDFDLTDVRPVIRGRSWPTCAWNVGGGRFTARVSEWPKRHEAPSLVDFLAYEPKPLSAKATAGFLARAGRSSLRFPPGFISAVEAHLGRVSAHHAK